MYFETTEKRTEVTSELLGVHGVFKQELEEAMLEGQNILMCLKINDFTFNTDINVENVEVKDEVLCISGDTGEECNIPLDALNRAEIGYCEYGKTYSLQSDDNEIYFVMPA